MSQNKIQTRAEQINEYMNEPYHGNSEIPKLVVGSCRSMAKEGYNKDRTDKVIFPSPTYFSQYYNPSRISSDPATNFDLLVAAIFVAVDYFDKFPSAEQQNSYVALLEALKAGELPKIDDLKNSKKLLQSRMHDLRELSALHADNPEVSAKKAYLKDLVEKVARWATAMPGEFSPTNFEINELLGKDFPPSVLNNIKLEGKQYQACTGDVLEEFRNELRESLQKYWNPNPVKLMEYEHKTAKYSFESDKLALDLLPAVDLLNKVMLLVKGAKEVQDLRRSR